MLSEQLKSELEKYTTPALEKMLETERACDSVMAIFPNMQASPRHLEALRKVQVIEQILSERGNVDREQ